MSSSKVFEELALMFELKSGFSDSDTTIIDLFVDLNGCLKEGECPHQSKVWGHLLLNEVKRFIHEQKEFRDLMESSAKEIAIEVIHNLNKFIRKTDGRLEKEKVTLLLFVGRVEFAALKLTDVYLPPFVKVIRLSSVRKQSHTWLGGMRR